MTSPQKISPIISDKFLNVKVDHNYQDLVGARHALPCILRLVIMPMRVMLDFLICRGFRRKTRFSEFAPCFDLVECFIVGLDWCG